ncbi:hypothetical protein U2F26_05565 [Micromonospora sp. 4G57]|uniref:Uncharacterized protein n=1 Tax=Micromonospora sicca TaxID=2202420 RepID=A0ABU5J8Y2_9ACTN|nr:MULTISPECIES: hypothetical protein [unclassified Micromonospora]MDZ5442203.1 hypothetical protein [Micromonospora sp. 4G57]MDZ5489008.1 hypothetical protein [Micromonospora sp. 4G53]
MAEERGYRRDNGERIAAREAWDIWAVHAYDILIGVAQTYHATITYGELRDRLFAASGIQTSALLQNWIGEVLNRVIHESRRRGEPPLSALVVRLDDGMVGGGYDEVLRVRGEPAAENEMAREEHAAVSRLACYRRFGAPLPPDGGQPALSPRLQAAVRARTPQPRRPLCPTCFVQLPVTGACDSC